jgi:hypothetical protein
MRKQAILLSYWPVSRLVFCCSILGLGRENGGFIIPAVARVKTARQRTQARPVARESRTKSRQRVQHGRDLNPSNDGA